MALSMTINAGDSGGTVCSNWTSCCCSNSLAVIPSVECVTKLISLTGKFSSSNCINRQAAFFKKGLMTLRSMFASTFLDLLIAVESDIDMPEAVLLDGEMLSGEDGSDVPVDT